MRRQLRLLILLLILPTSMWAANHSNSQPSHEANAFTLPHAGEQDSQNTRGTYGGPTLLVLTKDGAQTAYALSEKPQVKFEGKNLHITSSKVDITYALSDIVRFTYADLDPSGIDEIGETQTEVGYQDGTLTISQLKAGATVTVYGIDGKQVRQLKATRAGTYRLNLSALPQGVYIIKADTITYKIMKR